MNESRAADAPAINQSTVSCIPVRSISLAIVVTVVLYVGMATMADWESFEAAVSALPCVLWVQVVGLSLLSYLLRFARWHHFIFALGYKVPILRNLEIYLAAFALTLTPGKAGETIRSVYLYPCGVSYPHSIGAFISERLLDLVAVSALASLAVSIFTEQRPWMLVAIVCIFTVVLLLRSRLFSFVGRRAVRVSVIEHVVNLAATVRFLASGWRVSVAIPLSLMAWLAQGVSLYLIVHALGYELTPITIIAIYCFSILVGAVSFIPGGLGATEAAIVLLLLTSGVNQIDALAASLISRGVTMWFAIGIGVLAMAKIALANQPAFSQQNKEEL